MDHSNQQQVETFSWRAAMLGLVAYIVLAIMVIAVYL